MGLHNKEHFEDPSGTGSFFRKPAVVPTLIAVTAAVFCLQLITKAQGDSVSPVFQWLAIERDTVLMMGQIWRLLTYAFCHSEETLLHIIFNMLALYFLGRVVAHTLGEREFLWMYLAAATFAGIIQVCSMALFPTNGADWALGASGAVSAVFVLFAFHYPRLKLYLFGFVPVQARALLALVVAYDVMGFLDVIPSVLVPAGSQVGHAAHLGGMLFGFLYFRCDMRITRWWDIFAKRAKTVELPRSELRVFNPANQPEVDYGGKVDDILQKIHVHGEESLSPRERRVLKQASEHMKSTRS